MEIKKIIYCFKEIQPYCTLVRRHKKDSFALEGVICLIHDRYRTEEKEKNQGAKFG